MGIYRGAVRPIVVRIRGEVGVAEGDDAVEEEDQPVEAALEVEGLQARRTEQVVAEELSARGAHAHLLVVAQDPAAVADGGLRLDLGARLHHGARARVDGVHDAVRFGEHGQRVDEGEPAAGLRQDRQVGPVAQGLAGQSRDDLDGMIGPEGGGGVDVDAVVEGSEHGHDVRAGHLGHEVATHDGHALVELRVARMLAARHQGVVAHRAQDQPPRPDQSLDARLPGPRLRRACRGHALRLGGMGGPGHGQGECGQRQHGREQRTRHGTSGWGGGGSRALDYSAAFQARPVRRRSCGLARRLGAS